MTATFATTLDYGDLRWRQRSRLISALGAAAGTNRAAP